MRAWHRPTPHASRRGDGRLRGAVPGALKLRPSRKIPKWSSSWLRLSRSKLFLIPHLSCTVLLGNRYLPLPTPARLLWGPRSMRLLLPVPWSSTLRQRPSPVSGQRLWCVMMVRLVWPDLFFHVHCQWPEEVPEPYRSWGGVPWAVAPPVAAVAPRTVTSQAALPVARAGGREHPLSPVVNTVPTAVSVCQRADNWVAGLQQQPLVMAAAVPVRRLGQMLARRSGQGRQSPEPRGAGQRCVPRA